MAQKVYFMNDSEFDVRAMLTFGVSVKEKENPIGYFGTGFKYAVAIILRLGGEICIRTGDKFFRFTSRRDQLRGKEFDFVFMNDQDANFTTHLGANWEPWQAFRELYCNCLDENGVAAIKPDANKCTIITVDCEAIANAFFNKELYFLSGEPHQATSEVEIFDKPSVNYFYRGIAVKRMPFPAAFSYNVKNTIGLSEDRIAKNEYELRYPIVRAIQGSEDADFCRKMLTAEEDTFEGNIAFDSSWKSSDVFLSVIQDLINKNFGVRESARALLKRRKEDRGEWPKFEVTKIQQKMIDRSVTLLQKIGIDASLYPIKPVTGLGENTLGVALNGVIYLSERVFDMGTKQVCGTILEEWVHNRHNCRDFDRAMQNWLFDRIISLGEEIVGEPV